MTRDYMGSRKTPRKILTLILAMILIVPVILPIATAQAKSRAQWTIMIYLDADNNLDYYGYVNVEDMMTVGSTEDVNVLVLWDKYDDVANLYRVDSGDLSIIDGFALNGIEANMGDPSTLRDFVKYTERHFRSDNYALILWDHGDDFRGCCWDDHPEDHLTHQEITSALSGFQINILAFDACVEGMIEVAYEYVHAGLDIDYLVATEGYVPNWGYPYDTILEDLTANPEMDSFALSKTIVDDYVAFYDAQRPASRLVELAAIDMSNVDMIVKQLGGLTDTLENLLLSDRESNHELIAEAKGEGNLGWSEYGWEAYIDLPTFVKYLASKDIQGASELYDTLKASMYVVTSKALSSAEGMGIFFPGSFGSFKNNAYWHGDDYLSMHFPHEGWWNFLQTYWGV
ncbi:MAG: clostripain-related cysteine peptidase [Promethearchaeota archaeon]